MRERTADCWGQGEREWARGRERAKGQEARGKWRDHVERAAESRDDVARR